MTDGTGVVSDAFMAIGLEPVERSTLRETEWTIVERVRVGHGSFVAKAFVGSRASLAPSDLARKSVLVAEVLAPAIGVPVPAVVGVHATPVAAVVVSEDVPAVSWTDRHADEAARALCRLHGAEIDGLSPELAELMRATEPNRRRVQIGVQMMVAEHHRAGREVPAWILQVAAENEPEVDTPVPIHGDYFRANLIALTIGSVSVIDWDLLGFGDCAWDLAFLLDASGDDLDPDLVLKAYGQFQGDVAERLAFHRRVWRAFQGLHGAHLSAAPNDE